MTREEAIEVIKLAMAQVEWDYPMDYAAAFDMAIKALEQEPTTKNDLGVDREQLKNMIRGLTKWYVKRDNAEVGQPNTAVGLLYDDVMFGIDRLPSVTPQEPFINKPCVSSGVCEHDKNKVLDKIREQIKSNLRGVEIALEVLAENHPLRQKMEGAKDTLEDCLELIDKADKEQE